MDNTVIVWGPAGCGKTRNAELLKARLGCSSIVDNFDIHHDCLAKGALHLVTSANPVKLTGTRRVWEPGVFVDSICSYREAMAAIPTSALMMWRDTHTTKIPGSSIADTMKPSNPKDGIGIRKWRQFVSIPMTVLAEIGVGMLEGGIKYARHNYRVAGVRASVYVDASIGHIMQWWEGEDLDPDTRLSHITKAICSLVVLRDATIQNMLTDDRPPKAELDKVRADLQGIVDGMFDKYPNPKSPYTEIGEAQKREAAK